MAEQIPHWAHDLAQAMQAKAVSRRNAGWSDEAIGGEIYRELEDAGIDPEQVAHDLKKSGVVSLEEPVPNLTAADISTAAANGLQVHVHVGGGKKTVTFSDGSEAKIDDTPERMVRRVVRDDVGRIESLVDEPLEE